MKLLSEVAPRFLVIQIQIQAVWVDIFFHNPIPSLRNVINKKVGNWQN